MRANSLKQCCPALRLQYITGVALQLLVMESCYSLRPEDVVMISGGSGPKKQEVLQATNFDKPS